MTKTRKINDCKSRRNQEEIVALLNNKKTYTYIAKKVKMSKATIAIVAKKNNINYKVIRADTKRNNQIKTLLEKGVKYKTIAIKFKITNQRVQQLSKAFGTGRWEQSREYYKNTINSINIDIKNKLTYKEIIKKHNLTHEKLAKLYKKGLHPFFHNFMKERNSSIISSYLNGNTAKVITKSKDKSITNPQKINNLNRIYQINTQAGVRRYPHVFDRSKGRISEKIEILKLIVLYRDEYKYTWKKITKILNKKHKTITGKKFSEQNVLAKYKVYKRNDKNK